MADTQAAQAPIIDSEQEGLDAFFRKHSRRAYQFALQMVGDPDDAMELTQEAFLRLHKTWARRDRSQPPVPLLYAILRNLAIDLLRKRSVRRETETGWDLGAGAQPGPDTLASREELRVALWRAIVHLPEEQREVLLLKDFHGLRYEEIARITGTTPALVSSRLRDARERLRRRLARYLE
ncbi:MAG: RNA polymerase sigma factor [Bryobacteraceae bacterium]